MAGLGLKLTVSGARLGRGWVGVGVLQLEINLNLVFVIGTWFWVGLGFSIYLFLEGLGFIEIVKGLGAKNVLTENFDQVF